MTSRLCIATFLTVAPNYYACVQYYDSMSVGIGVYPTLTGETLPNCCRVTRSNCASGLNQHFDFREYCCSHRASCFTRLISREGAPILSDCRRNRERKTIANYLTKYSTWAMSAFWKKRNRIEQLMHIVSQKKQVFFTHAINTAVIIYTPKPPFIS